MPNLVGIWDPTLSAEAAKSVLGRQLRRVRVPGIAYQEYSFVQPGFAMGLQDHGILENGPQPAEAKDRDMVLVLDGELLNALELKTRYRRELPNGPLSTPELCLHLILRHGIEIVKSFNGLFCLVLYNRSSQQLTVITDRYGFRPLFYLHRQNCLIFGSELKAVCAADPSPRAVDPVGTLEYFCYGSHVMERTAIEGYWRLAPATIMTMDADGVRQHTYWRYKYDESAPTLDQPTYVTTFSLLLDRAVERCMKGSRRIGLFLSGGYDSRSLAACIREHYLPLPAFTFGSAQSRDVRYAAMLAARLGLEHFPLTDQEPYLYRNCRSIVWRSEGMLSFANATSIRYHPLMKAKMDIILLGFLAEFGGSHTWPRLLLARSRRSAIKAIYDRMLGSRGESQRRVFHPSFFEKNFEVVRSRFEKSFENVSNEHPMNVADCWNLIHLQPRGSYQSPSIDRYQFEARAPHMDTELVDFLLTIPPHARLEQRVYKKVIAYSFPKIRQVPCTNSGLPINPNFASEYASMILRYLKRKTIGSLANGRRELPAFGREFRDLDEDFRAEPLLMDDILKPLLKAEVLPGEIFNHAEIEKMIDEHYNRNRRHGATLSTLISWGLAAKYLVQGDLSDVPAEVYAP